MSDEKTGDAIVIENVVKSFKRTSKRREFTTLKTELIRILKFQRKMLEPVSVIEALKGVDLRIKRGSTVAVIGRNGSGKSTLLKLVTGIYSPTSGSIRVNGRISALLELGAGFHPDFTGRENIMINGIILGMSRAEVKARVEQIVEFAELGDFIDEPVRTYSSGMFMRLAFAVATHVDPDILIIDEILSVGDEHFQRKSQAKMNEFRRGGHTILLVTHSLEMVESWCDHAAWVDGGRIRMFGPPREVVAEYRRAVAAAELEAQKTGHSALSMPGLALPETTSAPPQPESPPPARLNAVRLRDAVGAQPSAFSAEGRLDVLLDYEVPARAGASFTVDLLSADGRLMFSTNFPAGELEGTGTVRLSLARLGLGEGTWELNAAIEVDSKKHQLRHGFVVAAHPGGSGLLRPEHAWSKEASAATTDTASPTQQLVARA